MSNAPLARSQSVRTLNSKVFETFESKNTSATINSSDFSLLQFISGHFDTQNAGAKREASSYKRILQELKAKPETVIFFTDIPKGRQTFERLVTDCDSMYDYTSFIMHTACNADGLQCLINIARY